MKFAAALFLLLASLGCNQTTPADEYENFAARTVAYRAPACESTVENGNPDTDLEGTWLIRSRLGAGLALGLRIQFNKNGGSNTRDYEVKFWLHDQPEDAEPLVITETTVNESGQFTMIADPLDLGKDVVQSESAVLARVVLTAGIIDDDSWCGGVTGEVTSPLTLDLDGSTFFAKRMGPEVSYETMPSGCPQTSCGELGDGGTSSDMTILDAGTIEKPSTPPIENVESTRINLTGDWILNASLNGLPLSLWITLFDRGKDEGNGLDGAVRLTRDLPDAPPRIQFFTEVDENGAFEIWFPELNLEIDPLVIQGRLLLSAVSVDASFCGVGAGAISSPFAIDLNGSTFFATPWEPGTAIPEELPSACQTGE